MPTAIPELIAAEVITRLEQITTGNGYAFNVASVERVNRDGNDWTPTHRGIVVVQGDEQRNEPHDRPGNPPANAYELPFSILCFVRQSDRSSTADQAEVNAMVAAAKKAVAEGSTSWHQFDGNSYDANWGIQSNYESIDHAGASVELLVRYRISEIDPFTLRN